MITQTGIYEISLDGGKVWSKSKNLLVNGFYETIPSNTIYCAVGSGQEDPLYSDVAITDPIRSSDVSMPPSVSGQFSGNLFTISNSITFDFGSGIVKTIKEVGILNNPSRLLSRALFLDDQGIKTEYNITEMDHLVIRYTIFYEFNSNPVPISIDVSGVQYTGLMRLGNPSKWTSINFGVLVSNQKYIGVCPSGSFSFVNGFFQGSGLIKILASSRSDIAGVMVRSVSHTISTGLNDFVGTFGQIVLTSNDLQSPSEFLALITLDQEITKTADEVFNISFLIDQVF